MGRGHVLGSGVRGWEAMLGREVIGLSVLHLIEDNRSLVATECGYGY